MHNEKVIIFKNKLKNYKHYPKRLKSLQEELELCYYQLGGVKGVDPSKEVVHSPKNIDAEYELRDKIEEIERAISQISQEMLEIERVVNKLDDETQILVRDIYFNGMSFDSVAEKNYMARETLRDRINRELRKIII